MAEEDTLVERLRKDDDLLSRMEAANRIEELEAALRYLVSECDEDMDNDYNPHSAPLAQARAALEQGESEHD
jgi:hypothetical protein